MDFGLVPFSQLLSHSHWKLGCSHFSFGFIENIQCVYRIKKLSSTMGNSKLPSSLLCPDIFCIAKLFWRQLHLSCGGGGGSNSRFLPYSSLMLLLRQDIPYLNCITVTAVCCRLRLELWETFLLIMSVLAYVKTVCIFLVWGMGQTKGPRQTCTMNV